MGVVLKFSYCIHAVVKVVALEVYGTIHGYCYDKGEKMYRVVYWNNGTRFDSWLFDYEIEAVKQEKSNGFSA